MTPFHADGCEVFAGLAHSKAGNLEVLGRDITEWLRAHPAARVVHIDTHLTGAEGFAWLTIVLFYEEPNSQGSRIHPASTVPPTALGDDEN